MYYFIVMGIGTVYYCILTVDNIWRRNACVYLLPIDGFGSRNVNEVRNVCELR